MNPDFVDLLRAFIGADVRFARPGVVLQVAVPPGRIDVLTELTGLAFADAWPSRAPGRFGSLTVDFLGRDDFATSGPPGRSKDLGDIEGL
jgi:hypothetical protein